MRYVFNSGYCFSVPDEKERELLEESTCSEYLKLGVDRVPAIGDIKVYKNFDRDGKVLDKNVFVIEEVSNLQVGEIHKIARCEEDEYTETIEAIIKIILNIKAFRYLNAPIWEKEELA